MWLHEHNTHHHQRGSQLLYRRHQQQQQQQWPKIGNELGEASKVTLVIVQIEVDMGRCGGQIWPVWACLASNLPEEKERKKEQKKRECVIENFCPSMLPSLHRLHFGVGRMGWPGPPARGEGATTTTPMTPTTPATTAINAVNLFT